MHAVVRRSGAMLRLAACLCLAGLTACAAPQVAPSGFLSDYGRLKPDPQQEGLTWWEAPGVQWKRYTKLIIEPVAVRLVAGPDQPALDSAEQAKLAAELRQAVVSEVQGRYPGVDAPGQDVLRVRAALTRLKPVEPVANVISTAVLMVPVDVGEAALEAQFVDSRSGKVLGELAIASRGSTLDLGRVWSRWAQVRAAFADWARRFRQALDEPGSAR
ncbi:MAG: DUF3313 domain-containing protein [Thermodesulfobacteriota bacterium]